jgi:hypothetical protein
MRRSAKAEHQTGTARNRSVRYAWHTLHEIHAGDFYKQVSRHQTSAQTELTGRHNTNKMSTKPKFITYLVALYLSKQTPTRVIATARHIAGMMKGNSYFPAPVPALADITKQAFLLENAYDIALTKVKGARANMLTERKKLQILLKGLANYVKFTADANQEEGSKIISSAGMTEHKPRVISVRSFHVSAGKQVGSLLLKYPSMRGAVIVYQMTTDPKNAASWMHIHNDVRSKYTVTGLTSGTRYYFRAAFLRRGIQSAWSPVMDFVVQ